jgi:hypothetical protein
MFFGSILHCDSNQSTRTSGLLGIQRFSPIVRHLDKRAAAKTVRASRHDMELKLIFV